MVAAADDRARALAEDLAAQWGAAVEVSEMRRLSGGASMETWAVDLDRDGSRVAAVLRRERPGRPADGRVDEPRLLVLAAKAGVPAPEVLASGRGWLLMNRIEGETIPRKLLRDDTYAAARPLLAGQCARALAAVHSVPATDAAFLGPPRTAAGLLDEQERLLDDLGEPSPAFELGLRWLRRRLPEPVEATLVHGDFRTGNLIVGPDGLRGVLDWELAHTGDPREDLGWFCVRAWRFGNDRAVAGGFGTRAELLEAYAAASGRPVDADAVRWWETCGTLRWGIMCMLQASAHLSGAVHSVELATIGRRVSENEYDLLELLAEGAA